MLTQESTAFFLQEALPTLDEAQRSCLQQLGHKDGHTNRETDVSSNVQDPFVEVSPSKNTAQKGIVIYDLTEDSTRTDPGDVTVGSTGELLHVGHEVNKRTDLQSGQDPSTRTLGKPFDTQLLHRLRGLAQRAKSFPLPKRSTLFLER